jgi:hypothetical protein
MIIQSIRIPALVFLWVIGFSYERLHDNIKNYKKLSHHRQLFVITDLRINTYAILNRILRLVASFFLEVYLIKIQVLLIYI